MNDEQIEIFGTFPEGIPLWNFDNPLFQKEIQGIDYRICDECITTDGEKIYFTTAELKNAPSKNKLRKLYSLYRGKKMIKYFSNTDEAKDYAKFDWLEVAIFKN